MITSKFAQTFFEPRIGIWYGKSESIFKKKILVLGDSLYCNNPCPSRETCGNRDAHPKCIDFTTSVVEDYLNSEVQEHWMKTYSTFINSLVGESSSIDKRKSFFNSVVFYNYLQLAAGKNANEASLYDTAYGSKKNLNAFFQVLDNTDPDIVICWGSRLWEILPNNWGFGEAQRGDRLLINDRPFEKHYTYPYNSRSILLVGVHHPSMGYDSEFHRSLFDRLNIC